MANLIDDEACGRLPNATTPSAPIQAAYRLPRLDEFPGQTFHRTLVRNANSIDIASRTLLVEVDVDNPAQSCSRPQPHDRGPYL